MFLGCVKRDMGHLWARVRLSIQYSAIDVFDPCPHYTAPKHLKDHLHTELQNGDFDTEIDRLVCQKFSRTWTYLEV